MEVLIKALGEKEQHGQNQQNKLNTSALTSAEIQKVRKRKHVNLEEEKEEMQMKGEDMKGESKNASKK